jgi:hypothetical protein
VNEKEGLTMDQGFWSLERTTGAFLVAAALPLALGVYLFLNRNGVQGGAPRNPALYAWERGSILAAVVLTALGLVVLEMIFEGTPARTAARIGAMAYFFGAVLLAAAEAMSLAKRETATYPLIVVYVVLALLGQAAVGAAIVQSGLLPAWIGWTAIVWNLAWLIILPVTTPADVYFPVLHHLMPLVIGASLLWRG